MPAVRGNDQIGVFCISPQKPSFQNSWVQIMSQNKSIARLRFATMKPAVILCHSQVAKVLTFAIRDALPRRYPASATCVAALDNSIKNQPVDFGLNLFAGICKKTQVRSPNRHADSGPSR